MKKAKRERLEAGGWKVGTAAEFLGLAPEESALIEIKLASARKRRGRRQKRMKACLQWIQASRLLCKTEHPTHISIRIFRAEVLRVERAARPL